MNAYDRIRMNDALGAARDEETRERIATSLERIAGALDAIAAHGRAYLEAIAPAVDTAYKSAIPGGFDRSRYEEGGAGRG